MELLLISLQNMYRYVIGKIYFDCGFLGNQYDVIEEIALSTLNISLCLRAFAR